MSFFGNGRADKLQEEVDRLNRVRIAQGDAIKELERIKDGYRQAWADSIRDRQSCSPMQWIDVQQAKPKDGQLCIVIGRDGYSRIEKTIAQYCECTGWKRSHKTEEEDRYWSVAYWIAVPDATTEIKERFAKDYGFCNLR